MKIIAYLDCPTGIAGDMCLGALVDAGVPLEYLSEQLTRLGLTGEFELRAEPVWRQGQVATRVHVEVLTAAGQTEDNPTSDHHPVPSPGYSHSHSRHLKDIEHLIGNAQLPPRVAEWSLAIFRRLAEAEGAVHGISPDQVHFHEVGAVDAIVDIVGTCLGLDWLQIDELACSALPTGGGLVRAAHGWLPVPAPAVLKLLQMGQVPIYSNGIQKELVTPTGAAIATTLATHFGSPPSFVLQRVGLGAGGHDLPIPNLLRLWIGQAPTDLVASLRAAQSKEHASLTRSHAHADAPRDAASPPDSARPSPAPTPEQAHSASPGPSQQARQTSDPAALSALPETPLIPSSAPQNGLEPITVLETQVDDLSPQVVGYLYERLLAIGALDVFTQSVGMKKSRPGLLITVICRPDQVEACEQVLFEETTTLGVRRQPQERRALDRTSLPVQTPYGSVRLKLAYHPVTHQLLNAHPEFEDCALLARQHQVPWQTIHRSALTQWSLDPSAEPSGLA